MLQRRMHYQRQLRELEQVLAAMPEFPIYREANEQYCIYTQGRRQNFASRDAACLGQLEARVSWLCTAQPNASEA
jgi:hypothetical protein